MASTPFMDHPLNRPYYAPTLLREQELVYPISATAQASISKECGRLKNEPR
jgi:hypothetical protein